MHAKRQEPCYRREDRAMPLQISIKNLQRHRAVSVSQHGFPNYISDRSNDEITHSTLIFTAVA